MAHCEQSSELQQVLWGIAIYWFHPAKISSQGAIALERCIELEIPTGDIVRTNKMCRVFYTCP